MRHSFFTAYFLPRTLLVNHQQNQLTPSSIFAAVGMILLFGMGVARAQLPAITRAEVISTVAGNGNNYGCTGEDVLATTAELNYNTSLAFSPGGDMYIIDYQCDTLRKVDAKTGIITTVAGTANTSAYTGDGGPAISATLNGPNGV